MEKIRLEGKLRVAAYCRVAVDGKGTAKCLAEQKAYCVQKIEENPDWELAGVFTDEGLDSLETVRMLRANGIGVIFEKENMLTSSSLCWRSMWTSLSWHRPS